MNNLNFLTLLVAYFFITFFSLRIRTVFEKIYEKKSIGKNLGFTGLLGIFLILYSYISHYFITHNIYHNSIIIFIGFVLFFSFYKKF